MKKIVLLVIVVLVLFGCASVPTEFDPTETPFEGEWLNWNSNYNKIIFKFTGNRWEFTYKDVYETGLFNYNEKILFSYENRIWSQGKILFSYENRKRTPQRYVLRGSNAIVLSQNGFFIKQPYGDLAISYLTKEKKFSDIVSNREELTKIQGTWRHYNKGGTYTFSGDQFTIAATGKRPVTGTIKIKDNILYLIVSDEQFGIFYLDFLPDNKIILNELTSYSDLWWGEFIKQ